MKNKPGTFLVHIYQHPATNCDCRIEEVDYRRQTLNTVRKQYAIDRDVLIKVDGKLIDEKLWKRTRVKIGSTIEITPMVGFLPFLVTVAVMAAQAAAGPSLLAIAASMAINAAIGMGLGYLGGRLFNQDLKQPDSGRRAGQSFGWNPQTTKQEGIPIPRAWGRNMHTGNRIALWTDIDVNGKEVLYGIICHGEGPTEGIVEPLEDYCYANDQPFANYSGVTLQQRTGTMDQTCMEGFEQTKLEYRVNRTITKTGGAFTFTTPNNFFDDIELTVELNLFYMHKSGKQGGASVHFTVEVSEHGEDDWTEVIDDSISGSGGETKYKAYKLSEHEFEVERGKQYDLRITKVTGDSNSTRLVNAFMLRSVREVVDVAFTYPGKALLGFIIVGSEQLSGDLNVKVLRDDRVVSTFNGTIWSIEHSSNRAWAELDILTQPIISGNGDGTPYAIERYEGLDISRVDLALLYEYAQFCAQQVTDGEGGTEDRMTCDLIVDYQTDIWSLAHEIAQVGRLYLYWMGTQLTGWVDKAVDEPVDLVTMDAIIANSWDNNWAGFDEMAGGTEVFYRERNAGYERKSIPCHNENAGLYTRSISLEGIGVTKASLANRVGNHPLKRNELIKNVNTYRQYKEALYYKLGDVKYIQANVPQWGKGYRVIRSDNQNIVQLDRAVTASTGDLLYVRHFDDETQAIKVTVYTVQSVDGVRVKVAETWTHQPKNDEIAAIGASGEIRQRRIVRIEDDGQFYNVTVETYNEDLYDSDDTEPILPAAGHIWTPASKALAVLPKRWDVMNAIQLMTQAGMDLDNPVRTNLEWLGNAVDTISWAARDADYPIEIFYQGTVYTIAEDSTPDLYVYWDLADPEEFQTSNTQADCIGDNKFPVCFNNIGVPDDAWGQRLINTPKVVENAINNPGFAFTEGSITIAPPLNTEITIQTYSFTSEGYTFYIRCEFIVTVGLTVVVIPYLYMDGTDPEDLIYSPGQLHFYAGNISTSFQYSHTPEAGNHTYYLRAKAPFEAASATCRSIVVWEPKR